MMMKKKKGSITLITLPLFIFVALSFANSSVAIPTTRSFMKISSPRNSIPASFVPRSDLLTQDELMMDNDEVIVDDVEGRVELEKLDYPGTGANNHHDPKPPGGRP